MAGSCEERPACTNPPGSQRSRWNANQHQLQHLERMFEEGNGSTPNKQRIKDIALDLSQYGSISDTNVYNWFQNRKARAKRKLQQRLLGRTSARSRLNHRSMPPSTATLHAAAALKLRVDEAVKAGEEVGETSPRAKRFKSQVLDAKLSESCLNTVATHSDQLEAGSSSVGGIEGELEEGLRSHVDFATLATNPNHGDVTSNESMIFSEDHFHEQVQGEAWDDLVRSFSCGESNQTVCENSHTQNLHLIHEDNLHMDLQFGVAGDKLISLAGAPVASMAEPRKGYAPPETT